jgi:CheY-like chemotaxis protein
MVEFLYAPMIVLLVDEKTEHDLFGQALKRLKIQARLLSVTSIESLYEMLDELSFLPDFIFIDLDLPAIDGYACFKMLQSETRLSNIPLVIYCSGKPKTVKNLMRRGAHYHLNKSRSFAKFCDDLKMILKPAVEV